MKIVTITHDASGIRINYGDKVHQFDNASRLAEDLARQMETVESLQTYIKKVREAVATVGRNQDGDDVRERLLKVMTDEFPF